MPPLSELLLLTALLLAIGAFAGLIAGLLGVGGGLVLVPAFFFLFTTLGYGGPNVMQVCLATSLATIVVTSIRSVQAHHRRGAVDWGLLRGWAPYVVVGAVLGMVTAAGLRSATLQLIFGVLAGLAGLYMTFGRAAWRLGQEMPKGGLRAALGTGLGMLSVLLGIGGGTFGVPMMSLYNVPMHRAVATASGFGLVIAVPSVIGFLFLSVEAPPPFTIGAVNLPAFALVICATLLTTGLGARLAHAMDPKPLKRLFGVFILIVSLNMLRKVMGW